MMAPRLFDLPRIDVLAAGNDHILLAVQDEKEAVVNDQTESLVCSQPSRFASMVANAVASSAALPPLTWCSTQAGVRSFARFDEPLAVTCPDFSA
jgi:hypothetical protein